MAHLQINKLIIIKINGYTKIKNVQNLVTPALKITHLQINNWKKLSHKTAMSVQRTQWPKQMFQGTRLAHWLQKEHIAC